MYFEIFPLIVYNGTYITDITIRLSILEKIKENVDLYDSYTVRDGENPEHIAYDLYGDETFHWIVLMMNNIYDPFHGWVMSYKELKEYTGNIYGSSNLNSIHHYVDTNGRVVTSEHVDAIPITNLEYEDAENEKKRKIRVLKPEYLSRVIEELETLIRNA